VNPVDQNVTADQTNITSDQTNITADGGIIGAFARVQGTRRGYYAGLLRDVADVFDIYLAGDFSNSAVSLVPVGNADYPLFGWMTQVPATTALYNFALANGGGSAPVTGTYSINSAGVKNMSIPRYVV
jgi:hypothetical protein